MTDRDETQQSEGELVQNPRGEDNRPITWTGIKNLIVILTLVVAFAVAWGALDMRVTEVEARAAENSAEIKSQNLKLTEIQIAIARVETQLVTIRELIEGRE